MLTVVMKSKMVSWNVRGLNDSRKHLVVRNLLREWNCDVVCLQETKLASMDRRFAACGVVLMLTGWLWMQIRQLVGF